MGEMTGRVGAKPSWECTQEELPTWQLWAKRLLGGETAILVLNIADAPLKAGSVSVATREVGFGADSGTSYDLCEAEYLKLPEEQQAAFERIQAPKRDQHETGVRIVEILLEAGVNPNCNGGGMSPGAAFNLLTSGEMTSEQQQNVLQQLSYGNSPLDQCAPPFPRMR